MKKHSMKKSTLPLIMPDFAKQERVERALAHEAKIVAKKSAFMRKHEADHEEYLRLMHEQHSKDPESTINTLIDMGTETNKTLDKCLRQMRVEEIDSLALNCTSRKTVFPINISTPNGKELARKISEIFDTLKLGDNSMFNVRYKRKTRSDGEKALIAQEAIFKMLQNVECYRLKYQDGGGEPPYNLAGKLAPLCCSNARDWFELIVTILEHNSDRKPWTLPFKSSVSDTLGSVVEIVEKERKRFKTPSEKKADIADGKLRDEFKKKLWAAFLAIINPAIRDGLPSHPNSI